MIKIVGLSKEYNKRIVLNDININIFNNACLAIIGKNGAGKTTLLNIIVNNILPSKGYIEFDNFKYNKLISKKIGMSLGTEYLIDEFTGTEYLNFIKLIYKTDTSKENIETLYNYFFDGDIDKNKLIGSYSQGMKTKISLCAALIHKPDILILDEPFANLDPYAAEKTITFLNEFKKNKIIIFSSHDLSYVSKLATDICLLDSTQIVFNGSLQSFTDNGRKTIDKSLFDIIVPTSLNLKPLDFILKD